jgi:putative MFS transporter
VFTLATAFAPSLAAFSALQLVARMLLVTELALAYVMLGEELPAAQRGRAMALLGAFASVGASLPALFLAPLEAAGFGWRGLFAIGALPLVLWPVYWRVVRETPAFGHAERLSWRQLFAPALRLRLAAVSALWWSVNFWSATALYFFTLYVFEERGWSAADLQRLPLGTIPVGFAGYFTAGWIMDRVGRRAAATLYLAGGTAAAALCFQSTRSIQIVAGYLALVGLGGLWTIASTITTELFPTALRATAIGLANNLIGRTGLIVGPIAAGSLAEALGSTGDAVTWLAAANLLCIPIVWLLPETRGVALEP